MEPCHKILWGVGICLLIVAVGHASASFVPNADRVNKITRLPGLEQSINFNQYAGYVTVDAVKNRKLFYWFVESQRNPSQDPLLVWLNGGPGASSLMGLLTENGPFRPNSDGKTLSLNPYSWNNFTNIIYIEAPAGVGFSFSDDPADYNTNDSRTASDNYKFLEGWFQLFPQFKRNDFYVTGESYGGHYVPELANRVLEGNKLKRPEDRVNIKGIAVGNPGVQSDWYFNVDEYAFLTFMYTHGLLPQKAYVECFTICGWSDFLTNCTNSPFTHPSEACRMAAKRAQAYLPTNIDFYNVLAPTCPQQQSRIDWGQYINRWDRRSSVGSFLASVPFDPCLEDYMVPYLNQPSVQLVLGVRPTKWAMVGNINYSRASELLYTEDLYKKFATQTDWKVLVFSGDADSAVPFIGTQRWISCLKRPVKKDWSNWQHDGQTAGSVIEYDGITFLTIKGAGHMVPWYAPPQAYAFFERWIYNKPF
jgi:serine carboxypeptidase-like clade 2